MLAFDTLQESIEFPTQARTASDVINFSATATPNFGGIDTSSFALPRATGDSGSPQFASSAERRFRAIGGAAGWGLWVWAGAAATIGGVMVWL